MQFYETALFKRSASRLLDEEVLSELHNVLADNPLLGVVVPGTHGLRKLRWKRPGTGKRGGVRVIYYFYHIRPIVFLLSLYAKNERTDLSAADKKLLARSVKELVEEIERERTYAH